MATKTKWLSIFLSVLFFITNLSTGLTTPPHVISPKMLNNPPYIPSRPDGPTYRKVREMGSYTTVTTDPDGDQVKYLFSWKDMVFNESGWLPSGTPITMDHFWTQPGIYLVTVQAMDTQGSLSDWSPPLIVQVNKPPDLPGQPEGPQEGCIGIEYAYCTYSTDPDNDFIQYLIDWDDGTMSGWSNPMPSGTPYCTNKTWYHNLNHPVNYSVKAKARDLYGTESNWSRILSVTIHPNIAPNRPGTPTGPTSGFTGETYFYCATTFHPNNNSILYQFDWGDGTNSTWRGPYASSETDCAPHSWMTQGTYNVKVKAKDGMCGGVSDWSPYLTVTISQNTPPEIPDKPVGPTIGKTGETYFFSASTTDHEEQKIFYNFSWGDNTYSPWLGPYNSGEPIEASHNWSTRDKYQIRVKAKDALGKESDWSDPLTITMLKKKEITPLFSYFLRSLMERYTNNFLISGEIPVLKP